MPQEFAQASPEAEPVREKPTKKKQPAESDLSLYTNLVTYQGIYCIFKKKELDNVYHQSETVVHTCIRSLHV